jgi:hypothetical protein
VSGAGARPRAGPRARSGRCRRASPVVDPVDGHLVDAQARPLGEHEQLCIEEPGVVLDQGEQLSRAVGADRLEAALRVAEPDPERQPQDQVARAGNQLALRAAPDARAVGKAAADRDVAVSREAVRRARAVRRDRSRSRRPWRMPEPRLCVYWEPKTGTARCERPAGDDAEGPRDRRTSGRSRRNRSRRRRARTSRAAGRDASQPASGSSTRKVAPLPGSDSAETRPPWAFATAATIERPRPIPPLARAREASAR